MKQIFTFLILAFAAESHAQQGLQDTANAPKFYFTGGETHDFGNVPEGPYAVHVFQFKNVGKSPLIISQCTSSCGCVVPEWEKEPVRPGKTGRIKVTMYTAERRGPFHKTVYIRSNALCNKAVYELYIKGNCVPDTAGMPHFQFPGGALHRFGAVPQGPDAAYTFAFKNIGDRPILIQECKATSDKMQVSWEPKIPVLPGDTGRIKVVMYTERLASTFSEIIRVQTSLSATSTDRCNLYIEGNVVPRH